MEQNFWENCWRKEDRDSLRKYLSGYGGLAVFEALSLRRGAGGDGAVPHHPARRTNQKGNQIIVLKKPKFKF